MFQWDKSVKSLGIKSGEVLHLFRSMRDVQLALPGLPGQQSSAYLCQYTRDNGVCTAAVFHLHKSRVLAFYFGDPQVVPISKTDSMFDQGLNFVESMGFLLTDQDIHLLDPADQEMLWSSLPLCNGIEPEKAAPVTAPVAEKKTVAAKPAPKIATKPAESAAKVPAKTEKTAAKVMEIKDADILDEETENVDELLAAVEAMRAKRPGLRVRKAAPSAVDMERRRVQLRETVGRILSSL